MARESQGNEKETEDSPEKSFERYKESGGQIDEKAYQNVLEKFKQPTTPDKPVVLQVEAMAAKSGIELRSSKDSPDPRIVLYGIMRSESNLRDQRLFAEVLRISGDTDSLKKLMETYPNIFSQKKQPPNLGGCFGSTI
ncbi:MAG: hypothetical protein WDN47_01565 [Candidatus Doudnabacteria bacterium]